MAIPSLMQKSFADSYDEFLFACSYGDYMTVERLLRENIIDRHDICRTIGQEKISPIVIAIEHHHLEVIKILLDYMPYSDFREALLLAIYLDLTKIAELIMEHQTFQCFYGTFADWQTDTLHTFDESHFAAIRPIHLAAQYNRITILYQFLKRGDRIEIPHPMGCLCTECKSAGLNDSLRYSQLRLVTYRALSSEVYLALVSPDPIASAFDLSARLSKLIKDEPNLASEYLILYEQVSQFSARLLDHIRNESELECLLTIDRLQSAVDHDQEKFLIHFNTQQRLTDIWYENINEVRSDTWRKRLLGSLYYVSIYIPMYLAHFWLACLFKDRFRWYFQQAAIQGLISGITYNLFLFVVLLSSILQSPEISLKTSHPHIVAYYHRLFPDDVRVAHMAKPAVPYLRLIILLWMVAFVYRNVSVMIRKRRHLRLMDMAIMILFILYIVVFTIGTILTQVQWQFILNVNNWKEFEKLRNSTQVSEQYLHMKSRFLLDSTSDSMITRMIADGLYTLTIVFCIVHLCSISVMVEYLGPLLLSLLTMGRTIHRWFILILIFIFAYKTAFLQLFSYYSDETSYGFERPSACNRTARAAISRSFGNLKSVTINIFLSLFGLTKNELTQTYINFTHPSIDYYLLNGFTSVAGSVLYGTFALFARIILMTMIIAYIKRLYSLNREQVFDRWKFARTKYYLAFMSKDPDALPVPLNLIPTPRHLMKICHRTFCKKKLARGNCSQKKFLRKLNFFPDQFNVVGKPTVEDVINRIVLRFLIRYHPSDQQSFQRTRQNQYKEELSDIRQFGLNEIQAIRQANDALNQQISTVFFQLDKHSKNQ